ncbi:cell division protein FtsA [Methyloraptor flagellatus]|jgi:cell division protein FtsA|uniref:Cell division protein FtsA n=1 Tax=Methyloraptor flagellatus TaxID=3162530 RepID=A0AAU7XB15_9HYPH
MRPLSHRRPTVVSVLDVGSSKVTCLIARLSPRAPDKVLPGRTHDLAVLGYGMQRARGMKSGTVIDLDEAEQSIRLAVDAAERMAGLTIESLILNITAGRPRSEVFRASVDVAGLEVDEADIQRVLSAGGSHSVTDDRSLVHSLPIGYALDGSRGIRDPRGMLGKKLAVDMHVVTADTAPIRNLELAVNRCHLEVETIVATPYASGLSTLVDDEADLGVALVDMGGGTTSMAVFADGAFCHVDAVAIGGHHVTMDIARGLSTRLADAERIKTLHGTALAASSDDHEIIGVPAVGEDTHDIVNVPRGALTRIIRPRIEETLELVRDRLAASGFAGRVGRRVVLTGGASQLTGLVEVARRILGRNVRLGRPLGIAGLPQAAKGPAYAAAVGLLIYPQVAQIEQFDQRRSRRLMTGTGGRIAKIGQWLRDSW